MLAKRMASGDYSRSLIYLTAMRSVRSVAAGIVFVVFPYMAKELLGLSMAYLGIIYATAGLATAGFSIAFGYLADLLGRKLSLLISSLLLTLSSLVMLVKFDLATAFLAAVLGGISATGAMGAGGVGGTVAPVQNAIIADITTSTARTRTISLLFFLGSLTAAAGTLLGGLLPYRLELALATIISGAALVLLAPMKLPDVRARSLSMRSRANAFKFSVTGMLNGLTNGLVIPYILPIFIYVYHAPRPLAADVVTAASVIATFSMLAAPALERKMGFVRSITVTRALTIPLMAAFPFVGSFWAAAALYLLYPAFRVIAIPVQQSLLLELTPPEERGRVSGYNQGSRLALSSAATYAAAPAFDPSSGYIWAPFAAYGILMAVNIYLYWKFFAAEEAKRRRAARGGGLAALEA